MTCKTCGPDGCPDRVACPREYETEAQYKLIERQGEILRAVVNAVRGAHPDGGSWSTHDAADLVQTVVAERDALLAAGQAVVDRWDSPVWKDQPHTGESINWLRAAIEASVQQAAEAVGPDGVRAALRTDWSDPAGDPSDAEIDALADEFDDECGRIKVDKVFDFARAVLALRPAVPCAQEPVGYVRPDVLKRLNDHKCAGVMMSRSEYADPTDVPLYAAPQPAATPRAPLTAEQVRIGWAACSLHPTVDPRFLEGVRFAERAHNIGSEGSAA